MAGIEHLRLRTGESVGKVVRRSKFLLGERTHSQLAVGRARELMYELEEQVIAEQNPHARKARQMICDNTLAIGNIVVFRPSKYHRDTFFRDLFLVRQFADSPKMDRIALDMFADVQDPETGYIPTSIFAFGKDGFRFPDESTFYYPILALQASHENGVELSARHWMAIERSTRYILAHMDKETGFIHNDPVLQKDDTRTYWADELVLPEADVVAFKQGLAVIALRAARWFLGHDVPDTIIQKAENAYRRLAQRYGGRLPLSLKTGSRDVSALYPEYLSIVLFDHKMLSDEVVKNTILSFATAPPKDEEASDMGLRVILDENGKYLPEEKFFKVRFPQVFMDTPGRYQNGGTWPIWDHAAWVVARLHDVDLGFLPEHVRRVFDGDYIKQLIFETFYAPEYLHTGRLSGEQFDDPQRLGQTWTATILDQRRRMEGFLVRIIH